MGSLSFPICFHLVEFRGVEVLRNRNPLFFGPIICVRSALYGSGYSTPSLRASTMIHRHVIEIGSRSPSCLLCTWLLVVDLSTCLERITALYNVPSVCPSILRACYRVSLRVHVHVVTDEKQWQTQESQVHCRIPTSEMVSYNSRILSLYNYKYDADTLRKTYILVCSCIAYKDDFGMRTRRTP